MQSDFSASKIHIPFSQSVVQLPSEPQQRSSDMSADTPSALPAGVSLQGPSQDVFSPQFGARDQRPHDPNNPEHVRRAVTKKLTEIGFKTTDPKTKAQVFKRVKERNAQDDR